MLWARTVSEDDAAADPRGRRAADCAVTCTPPTLRVGYLPQEPGTAATRRRPSSSSRPACGAGAEQELQRTAAPAVVTWVPTMRTPSCSTGISPWVAPTSTRACARCATTWGSRSRNSPSRRAAYGRAGRGVRSRRSCWRASTCSCSTSHQRPRLRGPRPRRSPSPSSQVVSHAGEPRPRLPRPHRHVCARRARARGDGAVEESAVVAHQHDATRELGEELLEPREAREVEVVGGLVEQEHVEARQQDRRKRRARRLPTRQRARREIELRLREPEVVAHRTHPRVEVGATRREIPVERGGVRVVGARGRRQRARTRCARAPVPRPPHRLVEQGTRRASRGRCGRALVGDSRHERPGVCTSLRRGRRARHPRGSATASSSRCRSGR